MRRCLRVAIEKDNKRRADELLQGSFYHRVLAELYKAINSGYILKSNRESGSGCYDLLLGMPDCTKTIILEWKGRRSAGIEPR